MLFKILFFDNERDAAKEYEGLKFGTVEIENNDKDEALLEFYRTLAGGSRSKVKVLDVLRIDEYDYLEPYEITVTGRSNDEAEIYCTRTFRLPALYRAHAELLAYKLESPTELVGVSVTKVLSRSVCELMGVEWKN